MPKKLLGPSFCCVFGLAIVVSLFSPMLSGEDSKDSKPKEAAGPLPKGVLAIVNGQPITQDDYLRFLFHSAGLQHLQDYIDKHLVQEEAKRLGVEISYAAVDKETDGELQRALVFFKNSREVYIAFLKSRGIAYEEHKEKTRQRILDRITLDQCVLKSRVVGPEEVKRKFEEVYGKDGISLFYRSILVEDTDLPGSAESEEKRKRAEAILEEAHATNDFAAVAKARSEDAATKDLGGLLPLYFKGRFGKEFDQAAEQLKRAGDLSDIFRTSEGWQMIQFADRRETRLEAVYQQIFNQLKTQEPTAPEREQFLQRLRAKSRIERPAPAEGK